MTSLRFRSIATGLVRKTVLVAVACVALVLALQTWLLWSQHRSRMAELVETIGSTQVPLLSVALWDIEPRALQLQIKAISDWPEIGFVRLRATTGQVFEGGDPALAGLAPAQVLEIPAPQGTLPVGRLELVVDPQYLRDTLLRNVLPVLLGYALLTTVV